MTPDPVSNTRISQLDPSMQPLANLAVNLMYMKDQPVRVVQGLRTFEEQDALYAIGRTTHLDRSPVTNARAGQSAHNFAKAIDVYPLESGKVVIPPASDSRWHVIGETGTSVGLKWGGDFKRLKDYPHLEMPNWREN
jgi:peptidoglycan LD-endopeptidase CwlK